MLREKIFYMRKPIGVLAVLIALILLLLSGIGYRLLAARLKVLLDRPITLPVALSNFPLLVGAWEGKDLTIRETTREYMEKNFADEYISRKYINHVTNEWADVYVVYCSSQPGGILGHQPLVCYPANGWIHDETKTSEVILNDKQRIPCLIHRFHKPFTMDVVVLNFYVLNGQITTEESGFSSPWGRRPNISGDPARYVAQIQISSVLENSVHTMAKDLVEMILAYLPDQNGEVRAAEVH